MNSAAPHISKPWLGVALLVVSAALWSLNGPLIKKLQQDGVSGLSIACYRSLLAGLLFTPFVLRRAGTLRNAAPAWAVGSVFTFTLMTVCFVIATTRAAASTAIILQYTSPLWVFLLSPVLLKEKPRLSEGLVLLVSMAGVAVIFFGNRTGDVGGLAIALLSGVGYGALIVVLRGLRAVDPPVVTWLNCLGSGLLLAPAVWWWSTFQLTLPQFGVVLFMSMAQFALPYVLFSWALRHVEAHKASLLTLLETILNPIWTLLLVGEAVPRPTLLGGPLILAGVLGWLFLTWRRERRAETPANESEDDDRFQQSPKR